MRVIPPALRDFAKGTQSRAFSCPTHFGGRGTERGLPAAGRDLLFVEQSSLVTARSGRLLFFRRASLTLSLTVSAPSAPLR